MLLFIFIFLKYLFTVLQFTVFFNQKYCELGVTALSVDKIVLIYPTTKANNAYVIKLFACINYETGF